MNSFIPWIGGKKLLRKAILAEFPPVEEIGRYVEVFGGAGWVLFGKELQAGQLEVYNDIDGNLVNLYRCIKYHCAELQRELDWQLVSREQFFDCKAQMDIRGLTDIQRAARYFIMIKISFGASKHSFGTSKKNLAGSTAYLSEIKERLKDVVIENKDFADMITVYDRTDALFYLDPPYWGVEKYYNTGFDIESHKHLAACLRNIKGRFILSYDNEPFITEMYLDFDISNVERNNSLLNKDTTGSVYKEVIIKNF